MDRDPIQYRDDLEHVWRETITAEINAIKKSADNSYPKWWHTWFSPATVLLAFTAIGVVWTTSGRLTGIEKDILVTQQASTREQSAISQRMAAVESQIVTKEWLAREISYQRDTYASKELVSQRMEDFQKQLNNIEVLVRSLNDRKK